MATSIRPASSEDRNEIARMMSLLWPEASTEDLADELDGFLYGHRAENLPSTLLVSCDVGSDQTDALTGFVQVGLRSHADGCDTAHPVGFIEGWYVHQAYRKRGVGRDLMHAAEDWARTQGCREMASDTWIDHDDSQLAHQALGFEVVDRCVHFRKPL